MGPQEREKASRGESEVPPQPEAPEGPTEPRSAHGIEAGDSAEAPRTETTVEVPALSARETGVQPAAPSALGGLQGVSSSQKRQLPERDAYRFSNFSLDFLFFSFF